MFWENKNPTQDVGKNHDIGCPGLRPLPRFLLLLLLLLLLPLLLGDFFRERALSLGSLTTSLYSRSTFAPH